MGDVYRARDERLDRDVALKLLPPAFTNDTDRLARFAREAKMLAALNHPNIAAIHGVEALNGYECLVLELVDGETLAARISRGRVRLEDALPIAVQIADALEAAHERGVIHRDLKPGNVMLDAEGRVKLLDFGLAKSLDPVQYGHPELANSPTMTSPASHAGIVLGTAPYMSPEQARGKAVDTRADIWAFGCVLFEMLAGRAPFKGSDVTEVLSAIIQIEPEYRELPAGVPAAIPQLIQRCLRKNPRQRLRHIGDARTLLEEVIQNPPPESAATSSAAGSRRPLMLAGLLAGVLAVALAVSVFVGSRNGIVDVPVRRFSIDLPWTTVPNWDDFNAVISPDGRYIAHNCRTDNAVNLCVRPLESLTAHPVAEGRDTAQWFFSADSQWLGFSGAGSISKVPVGGGQPQIVYRWRDDESRGTGFLWRADGSILYGTPSGLRRIPASGGPSEAVTSLTKGSDETGHASPRPLGHDSRRVLISIRHRGRPASGGLVDLTTGSIQEIPVQGTVVADIRDSWLVFAQCAALLAAPFDPSNPARVGTPVALIDNVENLPTLADDGTLAYVSTRGDLQARLVWVDRQGRATPVPGERRDYAHLALAPDDRRAVLNLEDGSIYLVDLAGGTRKLLSRPANFPIWADAGKRVIFQAPGELWSVPSDGDRAPQRLMASDVPLIPTTWNPLTKEVAYYDRLYQLHVLAPDGTSRQILERPGRKRSGRFSPDGKWIAYVSDETGEYQVYVAPYPGPGASIPVSTTGGLSPVWSGDGRELYFRLGSRVMRAPVSRDASRRFEVPTELMDGP